jgi:hypothetical protein
MPHWLGKCVGFPNKGINRCGELILGHGDLLLFLKNLFGKGAS